MKLTRRSTWILLVMVAGVLLAGAIQSRRASTGDMQPLGVLSGHSKPVRSVAFSPDAKLLASAGDDQTVRIWDLATRQVRTHFTAHKGTVNSVAFSPDGKLLASASDDRTVKVWNLATNEARTNLTEHTAAPKSVAFSPNGEMLASNDDHTIIIWDCTTWRRCSLIKDTDWIWMVAFSPDGNRIAAAAFDSVKVWDVRTTRLESAFRKKDVSVVSLAISSDNKTLAAGNLKWTINIWDMHAGQESLELKGHYFPVGCVAFSPDGSILASAAWGATWFKPPEVKIWKLDKGNELIRLRGHRAVVNTLAFSADGKRLATAASDGTINLWDVDKILATEGDQ